MERVRVCLHAGNTIEQVVGLAKGFKVWEEKQEKTSRKSETLVRARL